MGLGIDLSPLTKLFGEGGPMDKQADASLRLAAALEKQAAASDKLADALLFQGDAQIRLSNAILDANSR